MYLNQNVSRYFIVRDVCFTSRSTNNLLTFIADRIVKVPKDCGATQAVVLDISKASYRTCHTGLRYKFRLYGVMKRRFILLGYFLVVKGIEMFWSTSHLLSLPFILRIFFPKFSSFRCGKTLWTVLKHKLSSKCAINAQSFLSNISFILLW